DQRHNVAVKVIGKHGANDVQIVCLFCANDQQILWSDSRSQLFDKPETPRVFVMMVQGQVLVVEKHGQQHSGDQRNREQQLEAVQDSLRRVSRHQGDRGKDDQQVAAKHPEVLGVSANPVKIEESINKGAHEKNPIHRFHFQDVKNDSHKREKNDRMGQVPTDGEKGFGVWRTNVGDRVKGSDRVSI